MIPLVKNTRSHVKSNLRLGALGGGLAAILTHPIDVIKTRIMTTKATDQPINTNPIAGIANLVRTEGIGVLGKVSPLGLGASVCEVRGGFICAERSGVGFRCAEGLRPRAWL